ncbi:MAG TPA: PAS domain S-box protein [Anaerolineales bacterium]|nr:PAS domain S-box protein [Anaerolineales bacterium]
MFNVMIQLGENFAALLSLIFLFSFFSKAILKNKSLLLPATVSLLFSAAAIFGMLNPIKITEGVIIDARIVLVALAGTFGGPVAALIAVIVVAGYRLYLGGVGMTAGIVVIILAGIIGSFFSFEKIRNKKTYFRFWVLGVILVITGLSAVLLLPKELAVPVLKRLFLPVLIFYPLATVLYGTLFGLELTRQDTTLKLLESESRFRLLAENSSDMISRHDTQGRYTYVSPACRNLLGYEPEELIGHSAFEFIHPDDIPAVDQSRSSIVNQPIVSTIEFRARKKDGEYIWLETTSHTVMEKETGTVREIHAASRDVTERKRAEEAIQESEEKFRNLFENMNDGFALHKIILDENGKPVDYEFVDANPVFLQRSGMKSENLIGHRAMELFPQTEQYWIDIFGQVAITGQSTQVTNYSVELNKYFETRLYCPRPGYFAGIFSDVTEAKEAEIEREKLITELSSKNAELERFTYTVSHDLKSPLVTIRGFLGYLEEDARSGDTSRMENDIQRITDATDKMQTLLRELLELSRIGRMMNPPETIQFEDLVQAAQDIVHGQLEAGHVTIHTQPNLPAVYGDRQRLTEALQNLLDNAIKYMGEQPDPHIEIGQKGEQDGKPIFFIKDNGIGIASEYHDLIFGLFNKLDAKSDDTGIGLALVKRIIEVHGGRIWVESEIDKGATFFFTLQVN